MPGRTVCNFALGISSEPFNPNVEVEVATLAFNAAEITQQIATGLASFDFSNFYVLACAFEKIYLKIQNVLLYAFLREGTRVESNDDAYWYEIIIPVQPNLHNSVRPNLTEEEVLRARLHRIIIISIYQRMAHVTDVAEFTAALQDLKYELLSLHILDKETRREQLL
jgi:hypothetical protein